MQYTAHITAGPAYITEDSWDNLEELIAQVKQEYIGGVLGYLQNDRTYKDYIIDAVYIMDSTESEDPVWSWHLN